MGDDVPHEKTRPAPGFFMMVFSRTKSARPSGRLANFLLNATVQDFLNLRFTESEQLSEPLDEDLFLRLDSVIRENSRDQSHEKLHILARQLGKILSRPVASFPRIRLHVLVRLLEQLGGFKWLVSKKFSNSDQVPYLIFRDFGVNGDDVTTGIKNRPSLRFGKALKLRVCRVFKWPDTHVSLVLRFGKYSLLITEPHRNQPGPRRVTESGTLHDLYNTTRSHDNFQPQMHPTNRSELKRHIQDLFQELEGALTEYLAIPETRLGTRGHAVGSIRDQIQRSRDLFEKRG